MLFSFMEEDIKEQSDANKQMVRDAVPVHNVVEETAESESVKKHAALADVCDNQEKRGVSLSLEADSDKRIKEIKIFYNNGTYETFLPEK